MNRVSQNLSQIWNSSFIAGHQNFELVYSSFLVASMGCARIAASSFPIRSEAAAEENSGSINPSCRMCRCRSTREDCSKGGLTKSRFENCPVKELAPGHSNATGSLGRKECRRRERHQFLA